VTPDNASERVVLITGAAGGLGRGLVNAFLLQGWCVAAAQNQTKFHGETKSVLPLAFDVANREQVGAAAEQILERWGRIDALINNAGVTADALCQQIDDADWDRVLAVNLKGAFLCAQSVLRPMLRQRDGHIINIASFSGRCGVAGQASYAAAKAGLLGLTQSLAKEVGSRNVRVNAVLPGVLPTPMTAKLSEAQLAGFASANVLGRINSIEEVARFIVFLATTRNISGQIFQLDSRLAAWS
jgi:3-oxoacyl-[acyl-carrier protein] reductase